MSHLTQFGTLTEAARKKAIKALEARFGQSIMPYEFKRVKGHKHSWRVTDTESGSMIEFQFRGERLTVIEERDGPINLAQAS